MKKRFVLVVLAVLLLGLAMLLALYPQLPASVPVHWNAAGEIDGWGPRAALFAYSAVIAATGALWLVLPAWSPKRFTVEGFAPTWWFSGMAVVGLLGYLQCVHLWGAWKGDVGMDRAILGGIGMFFVLAGNVMGKVRRNFWLGVRTPWTLSNERVWYATHRLAAKTMVAGGLLALAAVLAGLPSKFAFVAVVGALLLPAAYSLVYYKRLERAGTLEA